MSKKSQGDVCDFCHTTTNYACAICGKAVCAQHNAMLQLANQKDWALPRYNACPDHLDQVLRMEGKKR